MRSTRVPTRGDLIQVTSGRQKPLVAVVLTRREYNRTIQGMLLVEVVDQRTAYPFGVGITGERMVLCDRIRWVALSSREVTYLEGLNKDVADNILARVGVLLR